jgi:hypothetical protein
MTPSHNLDEKISQLSQMLTFVNLAGKEGTNLREIALTDASLHMLFLAIDLKKRHF